MINDTIRTHIEHFVTAVMDLGRNLPISCLLLFTSVALGDSGGSV